ncbi:sugar kinase [Sanguibacter antarcticus]|uniref:2-keto-3-deoxygluconate kinase n=1 Tax=Sanguibacter antarcticus TaxID=372484 RepID=A0A2A9E1W7_9MICO|nr:sugar kinase [Sanguibacter antarcticus]PFG32355.1 2-keto-3-deoxygluconate kinase [Sanguibacter antarcticus]
MSETAAAAPITGLDAVTFGEVMGMFVAGEAGPLENVTNWTLALAGAEANVATGLARLGHQVGWIGRVGTDPLGRFAIEELSTAGVQTSIDVDPRASTGLALKSRADGGDPNVVYFRHDSAGSRLEPTSRSDETLASARHIHLTGIPLALSEHTRRFAFRALDIAKESGATISFDPNLRPALWNDRQEMIDVTNTFAARADWILPGLSEAEVLTGLTTPSEVAAHYLRDGASLVAVKDGSRGATLHTEAGSWSHGVFPVTVVDTVGAGDGFATGLISAMLDALPPTEVLERGAAVGAMAITSAGDKDGLPDRAQLARFLASMASR